MKSMLNFDISMFSDRLNCTRQPPEARSVDANSYVGSGSITPTSVSGAIDLMKCATLQPITPPPMIATLNRRIGCAIDFSSMTTNPAGCDRVCDQTHFTRHRI